MARSHSARRRRRLPGRAALLLGLGALSAQGAQAAVPPDGATVRSEGGRIYLSEGGRESELLLGATAQRDRLLRLLEEHGPAGVRLDADPRLIMSGGGGAGFSLWDARRPTAKTPPRHDPAETAAPPSAPDRPPPQRDRIPATDKKG
jgi:hypothetical protein